MDCPSRFFVTLVISLETLKRQFVLLTLVMRFLRRPIVKIISCVVFFFSITL